MTQDVPPYDGKNKLKSDYKLNRPETILGSEFKIPGAGCRGLELTTAVHAGLGQQRGKDGVLPPGVGQHVFFASHRSRPSSTLPFYSLLCVNNKLFPLLQTCPHLIAPVLEMAPALAPTASVKKFTTVSTMESTSSDVVVVVVRNFFLFRKDYAYRRTWSRSTKQGIENGERRDFKRTFCILSREGKARGYLSIKAE